MNICTSEFADAGSKTGRFSARIKCRAFVVLILLLWSCVAVTYGLPPYFRQPVWTANGTALTYGLTETDPDIFATADAFSYTRWGNVMFEGPLSDPFYFTPLTFGPFNESNGDLFLSDGHGTSGAPLSRHLFAGRAFPIGSNWSTGNFPYQDRWGDVRLNLVSTAPATLFRYLHFPKLLFNELDGQRIGSETMKLKKLIILIHGWNPPNVLADSFITPEFNALSTNLKSRLNDAGRNWGLIHYHWEADADTGGLDWGAGVHNPPEAASIAHLHGQNLGELLATAAPDLEKVHFIAHSAGAWAARSAAKYLLNATLSQNRKIIVQVTLLDPYMPQETPYVGPLSHLGKTLMNRFDEIPGNDRLWQLDNYYSWVLAALEGF